MSEKSPYLRMGTSSSYARTGQRRKRHHHWINFRRFSNPLCAICGRERNRVLGKECRGRAR